MLRILATCLLIAALSAQAASPEAERWRADLRVLAAEVPKRHKNPFHTVTREEFDAAVAKLDRNIPDLTRNQIIVELARIVASIGDGHTRLGLPTFDANGYRGMGRDYLDADEKIGFRQYPLRLYVFDDGTAPFYAGVARAAGDRKLAIDSFRRVVELNPVNQSAVDALKELLAEP